MAAEERPYKVRNERRNDAARLLRRASLRVDATKIDTYAKKSWPDGVRAVMDQAPNPIEPPAFQQDPEGADNRKNPEDKLIIWWINQMGGTNSGIHERMTWFWHGVLTTHRGDVGKDRYPFLHKQLTLLRTHALGNYRAMMQAFVIDGALLQYLNGDGSKAGNPNENLSRELMELFTLGVGNYTEDDVQAGAVGLAGWRVDRQGERPPEGQDDNRPYEVSFERKDAFRLPLLYRGIQDKWNAEKIVDHLCDDPRTAAYISRKVWHYLGGGWLNEKDATNLGKWWQGKNLEIKPLVEKALLDMQNGSNYTRPRAGFEFYLARSIVMNEPVANGEFNGDYNPMRSLGQTPYEPPNVAGWPTDNRWLEPGSMIIRGGQVFNSDLKNIAGWQNATDDQILDTCGIHAVSDKTRTALSAIETKELGPEDKAKAKWYLALSAPEFHLI